MRYAYKGDKPVDDRGNKSGLGVSKRDDLGVASDIKPYAPDPVLGFLNTSTRSAIEREINRRGVLLDQLSKACGGDADCIFNNVFGVRSSGMEVLTRPYGVYFYGDDSVFSQLVPLVGFMNNRGVSFPPDPDNVVKRREFLGMVGFGDREVANHEFEHMFNSMLPFRTLQDEFEKLKPDISRPTDDDSIQVLKSRHYRLWANSFLKDEILARITNGQIMNAEEQTFDDVYSGGGRIFKTYEPDTLFEYVSPYKSDAHAYGVKPVSHDESDRFWERYHAVVDPIRRYWLDAYNLNIRLIKNTVSVGADTARLRAIIVETPFDKISEEIRRQLTKGK